jgi:hypothetical protein
MSPPKGNFTKAGLHLLEAFGDQLLIIFSEPFEFTVIYV